MNTVEDCGPLTMVVSTMIDSSIARDVPEVPAGRDLTPRRLALRILQCFGGTGVLGVAVALLLRARLGLLPWDVWHAALTTWLPLSMGTALIATNVVVLAAWTLVKVRAGIGTVICAVVPGWTCDAVLRVVPTVDSMLLRVALLVGGAVLFAIGTAVYLGAQLGPGPRDGLMLGLVKLGWSVRSARISLDVGILLLGWLATGIVPALQTGRVGVGTVVVAVAIGPMVAFGLRWTQWDRPGRATQPPSPTTNTAAAT